jgi:hypothetical protein
LPNLAKHKAILAVNHSQLLTMRNYLYLIFILLPSTLFAREWSFIADMNYDHSITISDLWLWFKWLYFYPGDFILSIVIDTKLGLFFELTKSNYGGYFSGIISIIIWVIIFVSFFMIPAITLVSFALIYEFCKSFNKEKFLVHFKSAIKGLFAGLVISILVFGLTLYLIL